MRIVAYFTLLPKRRTRTGLNPPPKEQGKCSNREGAAVRTGHTWPARWVKRVAINVGTWQTNAQRHTWRPCTTWPQFDCFVEGSVASPVTTVQNW